MYASGYLRLLENISWYVCIQISALTGSESFTVILISQGKVTVLSIEQKIEHNQRSQTGYWVILERLRNCGFIPVNKKRPQTVAIGAQMQISCYLIEQNFFQILYNAA